MSKQYDQELWISLEESKNRDYNKFFEYLDQEMFKRIDFDHKFSSSTKPLILKSKKCGKCPLWCLDRNHMMSPIADDLDKLEDESVDSLFIQK